MKLDELSRAGRSPSLPLDVELGDGAVLRLQRWLRVLPGRRYVAQADWQGRPVLAKLMVGPRFERRVLRERQGSEWLAGQQLPTPALLAHGLGSAGGWLLFDYFDAASDLEHEWQAVAEQAYLSDAQQHLLGDALQQVALLHRQGLWQEDLHLGNLLRHQGRLYLIDGDGVRAEQPGQPLSSERVTANLGLFFGQLPAALDAFAEELLVHYLMANGEHGLRLEAILEQARQVRQRRLADYLDKATRDCTLFERFAGEGRVTVCRRQELQTLQALLDDPDQAFAQGTPLKQGGSATVARLPWQSRQLIVKRYNIKGLGHWLKRFWRPSRAWHAWLEGNRLSFLGIATARPLAVIEQRWFGLRGQAWLVNESIGGESAQQRLTPYLSSGLPDAELQALVVLFDSLIRARISHGDLKGSNVLWNGQAWALIDLDAMRQHRRSSSFARAYAKDRERFIRNWPLASALSRQLQQHLPTLP